MDAFLYRIAAAFHHEYGNELRKFTFVFPNRRAGLFFQKYLTELIDKPIFSPEIMAVNDCFFKASERVVVDRTDALFRLFRLFREASHSNESFDDFIFWGEMLLADFDEADKFRVDTAQLFSNVKSLKEIDAMHEYLSETQREAVKRFWQHFLPVVEHKTKEEFVAIWRLLLPLYHAFREELLADNQATEGMVFREIAEKLETLQIPDFFKEKRFVFVGFNALNPCEKTLFAELQKRGQADFYWDYESAQLRDTFNRASLFYADNLRNFPSKLKIDPIEHPLPDKEIELIAIPSSVGQVKTVSSILESLYPDSTRDAMWMQTAVVLPDETLLVPMLHSFPENIMKINITMGFPLKSTPVASLLENIFDLHRRANSRGMFYHVSVMAVLNHQYVSVLCGEEVKRIVGKLISGNLIYVDSKYFENDELLRLIFKQRKEPMEFVEYLLEVLQVLNLRWQRLDEEVGTPRLESDFLYHYYITISRLRDVMANAGELDMSLDAFVRLVRQLVAGITIPFEGEPLNGLQVMGMLETRGLDFENLIVCSFNEGVFPKKQHVSSFVPYSLRRAFGMPTDDYHDAISAYNFYRLIQRTNRLFFLYDSRSEGMQTGEVSRYLHQLQYHYDINIKRINVVYDIQLPETSLISVTKTDEVMAKLNAFTTTENWGRFMSASSINMYIDCPLKFYFNYVERMQEQDEVTENVEAGMFGTLLHYVMEHLYKPFEGKLLQQSTLDELAKNSLLIDRAIREAFTVEFFKKHIQKADEVELEGDYLLNAKILHKFVQKIVKLDATRAPFRYIQSEKNIKTQFPIRHDGFAVNIVGKIDRVDEREGVVRVLDYKTGSDKLEFISLEKAFEKNVEKRPKVVLQTFLYSLLYQLETGTNSAVSPEVLSVREVFKSDVSTELMDKERKVNVRDFNDYREEFVERLSACLEEIFNPDVPFSQCEEKKLCAWCPYIAICRRDSAE